MSDRNIDMETKGMWSSGEYAFVPVKRRGPKHPVGLGRLRVTHDNWETVGKYMKWLPKGLLCPNCNTALELVESEPDDEGFVFYQCPECMTSVHMPMNGSDAPAGGGGR